MLKFSLSYLTKVYTLFSVFLLLSWHINTGNTCHIPVTRRLWRSHSVPKIKLYMTHIGELFILCLLTITSLSTNQIWFRMNIVLSLFWAYGLIFFFTCCQWSSPHSLSLLYLLNPQKRNDQSPPCSWTWCQSPVHLECVLQESICFLWLSQNFQMEAWEINSILCYLIFSLVWLFKCGCAFQLSTVLLQINLLTDS